MMHWKASRLLAALPDDSLPPGTAVEVRAHALSCARCRTRLYELQLSEALLRRIPPAIVPIDDTPNAYARLAALARWSEDRLWQPHPQGWRVSLVSVASALVLLCVAASAGSWAPSVRPGVAPIMTIQSFPPDYAFVSSHGRFR